MSSSSLRPEPAAKAPLLQSASNESAAPLANVILMKSASRQASPATRCGAYAMLRCDGDATAMRRRCDGDANAQTATQPRTGGAQKPAQKPVQNMQIFLAKILQDSDTYSSRYMQVSGS